MKLWIDDIRPAPCGWLWVMNSRSAVELLSGELGELIEEVSLDHDLGGEDTTRPVVLWMCENRWPDKVHVHTANLVGREWVVVGREWIEGMIARYKS